MSCQQFQERLGRWFDAELGEAEGQAVAEHVERCQTCQELVESWRRLDGLLDQEVSTTDLAPAVLAALARERRPRRAGWLKVAAALVLALSLGVLGGRSVGVPRTESLEHRAVPTGAFDPGLPAGLRELASDLTALAGEDQ